MLFCSNDGIAGDADVGSCDGQFLHLRAVSSSLWALCAVRWDNGVAGIHVVIAEPGI